MYRVMPAVQFMALTVLVGLRACYYCHQLALHATHSIVFVSTDTENTCKQIVLSKAPKRNVTGETKIESIHMA